MVRGYLHNWLDDFDVSSTSDSYRVRYESTAVLIGCEERAEYTSVKVTAVVLTEIGENAPLGFLAVLNPDVPFGKFCYYPDRQEITLEYELIGESMDEGQFRNAVALIAQYADHWDDRLQREFSFGGRRFVDTLDAQPSE